MHDCCRLASDHCLNVGHAVAELTATDPELPAFVYWAGQSNEA